MTSTACAPSVKVGWWKWQKGSLRRAIFPACLVANENYHHFRVVLVRTDPATERLILTAAQLDALKCHAGDRVRLVRLCAEEKTV